MACARRGGARSNSRDRRRPVFETDGHQEPDRSRYRKGPDLSAAIRHRLGRSRLRPAKRLRQRSGRRARRAPVRGRSPCRPRKERARGQRFQHGSAVVEAKRWAARSIARRKGKKDEAGTPPSQMLRYLRRVDDVRRAGCAGASSPMAASGGFIFRARCPSPRTFWRSTSARRSTCPAAGSTAGQAAGLTLPTTRPGETMFFVFPHVLRPRSFLAWRAGETFQTPRVMEGKSGKRGSPRPSRRRCSKVFPALADALAKADPAAEASLSARLS